MSMADDVRDEIRALFKIRGVSGEHFARALKYIDEHESELNDVTMYSDPTSAADCVVDATRCPSGKCD